MVFIKVIRNMNKIEIIRENFPNLSKMMLIKGQKQTEHQIYTNRQGQNRNSHPVKLKTLNVQNKDKILKFWKYFKILKAAKEKDQVTYEGWPVRININNKHDLGESREKTLFTMS